MSPASASRDGEQADWLFPGEDETAVLARSTAWSETALGDPGGWSPELTAAIRTVMPSKVPMLLWWGDELVQIYNDAYRSLLGSKHPAAMGQPASTCWAEVWDDVGPMAAHVRASGEATFEQDLLLFIDRHGYLEETYWTFSYSPVRSADGGVLGIFVATTDVTMPVVEARRLGIVRDLAVLSSADYTSREAIAEAVTRVLAKNRQAVPFAAIYLPDEAGGLVRAAQYGLAGPSPQLPDVIGADSRKHPIVEVATSRVRLEASYEPEGINAAPGPLGPLAPSSALVVPLGAVRRPLEGVLVLGINPYRRADERFSTYATLVTRQLSALFVDVRAAADERARTAALAELDRTKTEFFANVSHEFRTPLTVSLSAVDELQASGLSEAQAQHVNAIQRSTERLNRLVDTLLNFAQAEAGRLVPHREPTDVAELTGDVVAMFRSAIESAGLALEADFEDADEDGASVRMIDPEAWVKIVGNLLSNAYKFTDTGSIRVGLQQTADGVVLTVRDTGSGIAEEDAGMVFQRFHQVASRPARGIAGTGIGLALVKDLVEAQGGQVTLESHPGRGSAFTVRIPAALVSREAALRAELALARTARGLLPERQPSDVLDVPSDLAGTRPEEGQPVLLLVEDNDDLRGYLTRLLTDDGWSVVAVPDAPSALQVESVPDLVLCDVMLPGPSGLDLVTTMRATAEWATVPVVLLTARSGAKEVASGLAVGANDYVGKPFDPIELLARLRTHHELALDRSQALVEAEEKAGQLRTALTSSRVIGMAVGVLMSSHRVTSDHAFDLLRVHSNNTNRKIRDVAEDVVLTGRIPPTP